MSDPQSWLPSVETALRSAGTAGCLLSFRGDLGPNATDRLVGAAEADGLLVVEVQARSLGLHPDGVARAAAPDYLGVPGRGGPDEEFCLDAAGDGPGARRAWRELKARWAGQAPSPDLLPPDDTEWRRHAEVLARILAVVGEVEKRLVIIRDADACDGGSLRVLTALLAGKEAPGWAVALVGADEESDPTRKLVSAVRRVLGGQVFVAVDLDEEEPGDGPALPQRGSSVELLDVLSAAPVPLPVDVVGSAALSTYRGASPRAGWLDFQGLLDSGRAVLEAGLVRLIGDWSPSTDSGGSVAGADCRALRTAVDEVLDRGDPLRRRLEAELASAGSSSDASPVAVEMARAALGGGDADAARGWLEGSGDTSAEAQLLCARAHRYLGNAEAARAAVVSLTTGWESAPPDLQGRLKLEAALACVDLDRTTAAAKLLEEGAELAQRADDLALLSAIRLADGTLKETAGDFVPAAKALGEAAQAAERQGDSQQAARAFAHRAVCMGKAGAADRAMKELGMARERAADPDDPHPAGLDVRILMGVVFRDSGSRESARKALALAAAKAHEHADPEREAHARLMLARFFLEAIPVKGVERGEALRDGREAAEAVVRLGRGMARADVEAEGEALLGELAWRAEDWVGALESLGRQQALWHSVGRATREVDVAIRRSRLAGRRGDAPQSFAAANEALTLATKRRLPEQSAQAQLARGEALEALDRGSEALAALAEAQRIFSTLGPAFEPQAAAAEERARKLVAKGR